MILFQCDNCSSAAQTSGRPAVNIYTAELLEGWAFLDEKLYCRACIDAAVENREISCRKFISTRTEDETLSDTACITCGFQKYQHIL